MTTNRMDKAWARIEAHYPPGGVRIQMHALLGRHALAALEDAKVVVPGEIANLFPCPSPGAEGCPRQILDKGDGVFIAFCGRNPPECDDVVLEDGDVRLLEFDKIAFTGMLRERLGIKGRVDWMTGMRHVCRVGSIVPEAGTVFPVFFVARCCPEDYAACFDVLAAQVAGPFASIVPTRRHITHDIERRLAGAGCVLVALSDVFGVTTVDENDFLVVITDVDRLFERLGQVPTGQAGKAPVVARAIIGRDGKFSWRDLDQDAYNRLLAQRTGYDIVADELTRTCFKKGKTTTRINPAYFATIRAAMDSRAKYDPDQHGPEDGTSGKQTFQRARQTFDIGSRMTWKLFKTDASDEVTRYDFSPDPDVSFVFIFAPSK